MAQLCLSFSSCVRVYSGLGVYVNNHSFRILTTKNPFYHRLGSKLLSSKVSVSGSGDESGTTTDEEEGTRRRSGKKFNLNSDTLCQILGMPRPSILKLISKKPAIRSTNPDHLCGTNNVFKAYGFQPEELLEYPELFMMTPNAVANYILIFKETGFKDIKPNLVLNYRELTKKNINILKEAGLIPIELNVVQHYCNQLQMQKNYEKKMWAELPEDHEQAMSLADVRILVLKHFLMHGLNCDFEAAEKIIKTYPRFRNRSFNWVTQNLQIVTERLKFPLEKALKHSYLLLTNPVNSLEILDKLPELGGRPIAEVISLRPKIFSSQVSSLQEISRLFDQHGVTSKAIGKYPEVYTLSPATVSSRLEEFKKIPEFEVLKNHPRVGRLIYYQNKIKKRLEYLQTTHQVYNSSLHILSADTEHFETFLRHGEMRPKGDDNVQLVSGYLNLPKTDVRKFLMAQPHWRDISPVSINSILNYLTRTKSFTVEQLKYALPVVLYPLDKVMASVRLVQESGEAAETDLYFLQMVLYFMERKGHFSGAGVWNNENRSENQSDSATNAEGLHASEATMNPSGGNSVSGLDLVNDIGDYAQRGRGYGKFSKLTSSSKAIALDDHITSIDFEDMDEFNEDKLELDEDFDFDEDAIVVGKYGDEGNRPEIDDLALHRLL